MSDLGTKIRRQYEEAAHPVDIEALVNRMEARPVRRRPRLRRGVAVAFATAIVILVAIGVPLLLNNRTEAPVITTSPATTTTVAPTTTIPTPTTPAPPVTTTPATTLLPSTTPPAAWSTFGASSGAPAGRIHQVLPMADGSVWAVGDGGIARYDGEEWQPITVPDGFIADPVAVPDAFPNHREAAVRAAPGPDGSVWFAHVGGVHRYLNGVWTAYPQPVEDRPQSETIALPPVAIGVMGDGSVWIAAGDILWTLHEETWKTVSERFVPSDEFVVTDRGGVYEIVIGTDGALWISHSGAKPALNRFDGTETRIEPYSWPGWYLTEVRAATADGAWILAGYGEADRRLIYVGSSGREEFPLGDATDVAIGPDGDVWVAVTAEPLDPCLGYCGPVEPVTEPGAYRYDGASWTRYTVEDGLAANDLLSVSVAEDGTVWFGTKAGVTRLLPEHADSGGQAVDW